MDANFYRLLPDERFALEYEKQTKEEEKEEKYYTYVKFFLIFAFNEKKLKDDNIQAKDFTDWNKGNTEEKAKYKNWKALYEPS